MSTAKKLTRSRFARFGLLLKENNRPMMAGTWLCAQPAAEPESGRKREGANDAGSKGVQGRKA